MMSPSLQDKMHTITYPLDDPVGLGGRWRKSSNFFSFPLRLSLLLPDAFASTYLLKYTVPDEKSVHV